MTSKTVIIIGGPTAAGKTSVAIELARHFSTEIISADSRQCFREMNIGVARPSPEELAAVPHHFIASHSIHEKVTAATFEQYALSTCAQLFQRHDVVVMVGGTGLYLRAFCEGFDPIPDVPETISAGVRGSYAEKGLAWLQTEMARLDPAFSATGEIQNPQRLMRALEVYLATGQSIVSFRRGSKAERPFDIIKTAIELPKEALHQRINQRVDGMMEAGLLAEVMGLAPFQHLNALQTVGYRELYDHLNGKCSLPQAVEAIKQNTRQYAKRQMTWFRKDTGYRWWSPNAVPELLASLQDSLRTSM